MPLTQGRVAQVAQAAHASFGTGSAVGTRAADPSKGSYAQSERTPLRCRKVVARGAKFRRRSTRYANSGRTPRLLEQLRFPLSNSPTRTFSHSTLSSSRPSAPAQLASLPGFSGCSRKPETQSRGLSRTPPTLPRSCAFSLAPSVSLPRSSNSLSSSPLRACCERGRYHHWQFHPKHRERDYQCHRYRQRGVRSGRQQVPR